LLAVLAVVSLIGGIAVLSFSAHKDSLDFSEFYTAAQMVREGLGNNLYDLAVQAQFQSKFAAVHAFYLRPSFEVLLFLPFTYVGYRTAYTLWTVLNLVLLVVVVSLIESRTKISLAVSQYARIRADAGLVLIIFVTFAPTTTCLLIGQDSILILLIYTIVFVMLRLGAEFRAGCVLACGLFKFHLIIPFVIILLLRRRWPAIKGFAAVGSLLILMTIAISGVGVLREYPRVLLFDSPYRQIMGFNPEFTPNIRGLLYLLEKGRPASHIFGWLTAIFSVLALWWAAKNCRDDRFEWSFSASLLATVLASYHLYNYDLTLLLLPIAIVCGELAQRMRLLSDNRILTAALVILFLPGIHFFLLTQAIYALMSIPILVLFFIVCGLPTPISQGKETPVLRGT
jgi:Glycosyltransferase family 87